MKKPWEEEWVACGPELLVDHKDLTVPSHERYELIGVLYREPNRARLAAAAPDLYRALEEVEFIQEGCAGYFCPCCYEQRIYGHAPDCRLAAALRKARGE